MDVIQYKLEKTYESYDVKQTIIVGGVAANKGLRMMLEKQFSSKNIIVPPLNYCTDNAVMIAAAAYHQYRLNPHFKDYVLGGQANLSLD
jgi:N6-L-threonylcarbamoyladenine synthase